MLISITRLEVKSWMKVPYFLKYAAPALKQAKEAKGNLYALTFADFFKRTFWTVTAWESEDVMKKYIRNSSHLEAMKITKKVSKSLNSKHYWADKIPTKDEARQILLNDAKTDRTVEFLK